MLRRQAVSNEINEEIKLGFEYWCETALILCSTHVKKAPWFINSSVEDDE